MIYWLDEPRRRSEIAARRTFWVTLALSFLIHLAAVVVVVQRTRIVSPGEGPQLTTNQLQVRMAAAAPKPEPPPTRTPPPMPPHKLMPVPKSPARPPKATAPIARPPPVIAAPAPAPSMPS